MTMETKPSTISIEFFTKTAEEQISIIEEFKENCFGFKKIALEHMQEVISMAHNEIEHIVQEQKQDAHSLFFVHSILGKNQEILKFARKISQKKLSKEEITKNINSYQGNILFLKNEYYSTQNQRNTQKDSNWMIAPVRFKNNNVYTEFTIPKRYQVLNAIQSTFEFIFCNILYIAGAAFLIFLLTMFIFSMSASAVNKKIETYSKMPTTIHEMLSREYFNQKSFREYVIFLEKSNKEQLKDYQWDISFNDVKRIVVLQKNDITKQECKSLVALKEISWDSTNMKINNIVAPVNYWTASDNESWPQKMNSNLCALNKNKIEFTFDSNKAKDHDRYMKNLSNKNLQFLINEHTNARRYYDTSSIVQVALINKVKELEQMMH